MASSATNKASSPTDLDVAAVIEQNAELTEHVKELTQQLNVLKKLLFGPRSEKRPFDVPGQGVLFEANPAVSPADTDTKTVTYQRGKAKKNRGDDCVNAQGLRFSEDVPVKTITLTPPEIEGLSPDDYEVIKTESRYKLAQHSASYTVLCYETPVVKIKSDASIVSAPPPTSVVERSVADVSLLAGLLVDKFVFHLPLYRRKDGFSFQPER